MEKQYELMDHTADIGLRVVGEDVWDLFSKAGYALFDLMVGDLGSIEADQEVVVEVRGDDVETVFMNWLRELLYLFEVQRLILLQFDFLTWCNGVLKARCRGIFYRPGQRILNMEVKAVTYHHLKVEQQPDGHWRAQVIFDI